MWIDVWLLVASGALYQPTTPPFYTKEDCEKAKVIYLRSRNSNAGECISVRVFVK